MDTYDIHCEVCEAVTEVYVDVAEVDEIPCFCPMCGSSVDLD